MNIESLQDHFINSTINVETIQNKQKIKNF